MKLKFVLLVLMFLAVPLFASSKRVTCAVPVSLLAANPGLFEAYYVGHRDASELAMELAGRIAGESNLKGLRPSNETVSRNSWGRFQFHSKNKVARRLLGIADFFRAEARKEVSFDLDPSDAHYWKIMNGFAIRVPEDVAVSLLLGQWIDHLARLQLMENFAHFNHSPQPSRVFIRVAYSAFFLYLILGMNYDLRTLKIGDYGYQTWALILMILGSNDQLFREVLFEMDRGIDTRMMELTTSIKPKGPYWMFHGTDSTLPLSSVLQGNPEVEDEDESEAGDGNVALLANTVFPSSESPPSFINSNVVNSLFNLTARESLPTVIKVTQHLKPENIRGLLTNPLLPIKDWWTARRGKPIREWFGRKKYGPPQPLEINDHVQVDFFLDEKGSSQREFILWFRRVPE